MTSIIKLHPFSGVMDESPPCYLLQVDEFRFLLDCGWDEDFSPALLKELKKQAHTIDTVLLSYPDNAHLGALPYMVGKCGLNCPVYSTIPVYKMGQMFMYDLYQSRHNAENFGMFTLDDVDSAFDKIIQLKYSQTVSLKDEGKKIFQTLPFTSSQHLLVAIVYQFLAFADMIWNLGDDKHYLTLGSGKKILISVAGKGHGLQITPLPAGHMLGGTIWKIVKDGEEEIVYAIDYNHKKERHLNGCVLESFTRPHLMITDAFNATYIQSRRRVRDEQLMTTILQTMRKDGNVLITVDTAGRMLELAQLLDQMWRSTESGLTTYSLALLNNVSFNVIEFAKSQVEWMSDKIMRAFEDNRSNPFHFKHMKLCHNLAELAKVPEPKVVLASVPDLQCGFSRDLFIAWCGNPKNSIVLTNRTSPGTLARWLIDHPENKTVTLEVRRRLKLEGAELEEFLKKKQEKEEEERNKADMVESLESESSEESEEEMEVDGISYSISSKAKHDLMMKNEGKSRTGFFKQAKKSYPMFPFTEEKIRWDEYGEIIKPEDYIILDTTPMDEETATEKGAIADESMQDLSEVPTKCISVTVTLDMNANIQYIDFEGRTDGESMRKILSQIKPRQLVLVHGSAEATYALADYCRNTPGLVQGKVFTPSLGEIVDATTESHIYQVKLKDYLVSALDFAKARDAELAWIDGKLDMVEAKIDTSPKYEPEDGEIAEEEKANKERETSTKKETEDMSLDIIPSLEALPAQLVFGHRAVFVNEPKLSDFKSVLLGQNIQAEFGAGTLICNDKVAVKRNEAGRIQLEGVISEDYFAIRDLLYEQYAIV